MKNAHAELDRSQTEKAARSLLKWVAAQPKAQKHPDLLADEAAGQPIYLILTTKKFISEHRRLKPAKLPLRHPVVAGDVSICLITKDPQRPFKDLVQAAGLAGTVTRVVGISKFKGKLKTYEAKRQLRDTHDLFLADARVAPLLPKLLGKTFISRKKMPLPIELSETSTPGHLQNEVAKARSSTLLHLAPGTCTAVKIALSSFTAQQIADNVQLVAEALAGTWVAGGWRGVRGLHIKTAESTSLPIWLADNLFDPAVDVTDAAPPSGMEANRHANNSKKDQATIATANNDASEKTEGKTRKRKATSDDSTARRQHNRRTKG